MPLCGVKLLRRVKEGLHFTETIPVWQANGGIVGSCFRSMGAQNTRWMKNGTSTNRK